MFCKKNWILLPKIGKIVALIIKEIILNEFFINLKLFLPKTNRVPIIKPIQADLEFVKIVDREIPKVNRYAY